MLPINNPLDNLNNGQDHNNPVEHIETIAHLKTYRTVLNNKYSIKYYGQIRFISCFSTHVANQAIRSQFEEHLYKKHAAEDQVAHFHSVGEPFGLSWARNRHECEKTRKWSHISTFINFHTPASWDNNG